MPLFQCLQSEIWLLVICLCTFIQGGMVCSVGVRWLCFAQLLVQGISSNSSCLSSFEMLCRSYKLYTSFLIGPGCSMSGMADLFGSDTTCLAKLTWFGLGQSLFGMTILLDWDQDKTYLVRLTWLGPGHNYLTWLGTKTQHVWHGFSSARNLQWCGVQSNVADMSV